MAIEDPTYVGVFDLLQARGLRAFPLPIDLIDNNAAEFARLLAVRRPRAILLVPAVHSPTGRVRRTPQLVALAAQLDQLGLPTIEDNTVADLAFTGARPPTLASLCQRATVITVESMSKVAWGGLRVGSIRADRAIIDATVAERALTDYGTAVPSQLIALQATRPDTVPSSPSDGERSSTQPQPLPASCTNTSPTGNGNRPAEASPPGLTPARGSLTPSRICAPCTTASHSPPVRPHPDHDGPAHTCEPASTAPTSNSKRPSFA